MAPLGPAHLCTRLDYPTHPRRDPRRHKRASGAQRPDRAGECFPRHGSLAQPGIGLLGFRHHLHGRHALLHSIVDYPRRESASRSPCSAHPLTSSTRRTTSGAISTYPHSPMPTLSTRKATTNRNPRTGASWATTPSRPRRLLRTRKAAPTIRTPSERAGRIDSSPRSSSRGWPPLPRPPSSRRSLSSTWRAGRGGCWRDGASGDLYRGGCFVCYVQFGGLGLGNGHWRRWGREKVDSRLGVERFSGREMMRLTGTLDEYNGQFRGRKQ